MHALHFKYNYVSYRSFKFICYILSDARTSSDIPYGDTLVFIFQNSIEKDIALPQLVLKGQHSDSWFSKLDEISEKYSLNSPHDLIVNPPTKSSWNRSVDTTINKYYITTDNN